MYWLWANNFMWLDIGWSRVIEDQAFGRVHCLGQTWVVEVQRLVIAGAAGEVQQAQVVLSSLNCKRPAAVSRESQKPTLYHAAAIAAQQLPSTGSKPPPPYGLHIQGSNHSHHLHRHTRSWELLRSQASGGGAPVHALAS